MKIFQISAEVFVPKFAYPRPEPKSKNEKKSNLAYLVE